MKKIVICMFFVFVAQVKYSWGESTVHLTQAGDVFSVIFAKADVLQETKEAILSDIELVFGHMSKCQVYPVQSGEDNSEESRPAEVPCSIRFSGNRLYRPEAIKKHFGRVSRQQDGDVVVISKELINAYENAILMINRLPIGQGFSCGLLDGGGIHAGLFVKEAYGSEQTAPSVRVAWIPLLVPLARVVAPAELIECTGLIG